VRATAAEIAERSGHPNGSVAVTLRGLVARGVVAKTETARGIEYSLVSAGSVQPFKRTRRADSMRAPAIDTTSSGGSPEEHASTTAVA
jgi:sugar-specific transcriptional regulator TrmB